MTTSPGGEAGAGVFPPGPLTAAPSPLHPWQLGATLYTPATRPDLLALGLGRYPGLSSLVYCTEDAVRAEDVGAALAGLRATLPYLAGQPGPLRLIRVRDPEVLAEVLRLPLEGVSGLVLPKVHAGNLGAYLRPLERAPGHLWILPTLETREAFSEAEMERLRADLQVTGWRERVLALRIGGNDLLGLLGTRRRPGRTLYEGPLQGVIASLLGIFKPDGYALSAPVYEVYRDLDTLERELLQDLDYGLCGKTIIHPAQLQTVLRAYRVSAAEAAEARAILAPDAPAVFQQGGRMCEPATHARWAADILVRATTYGLYDPPGGEGEA